VQHPSRGHLYQIAKACFLDLSQVPHACSHCHHFAQCMQCCENDRRRRTSDREFRLTEPLRQRSATLNEKSKPRSAMADCSPVDAARARSGSHRGETMMSQYCVSSSVKEAPRPPGGPDGSVGFTRSRGQRRLGPW
jgi:hypothetical protein